MALQKLRAWHQDADFSHGLGRMDLPLPGVLEDGIRYYKRHRARSGWPSGTVDFDFGEHGEADGFNRGRIAQFAMPNLAAYGFETPEAVKAAFDQAVASGDCSLRNRRSATWRDPIGCATDAFDCRLVERRRLRPGGYFPSPDQAGSPFRTRSY